MIRRVLSLLLTLGLLSMFPVSPLLAQTATGDKTAACSTRRVTQWPEPP
jgi:hypothetical protein